VENFQAISTPISHPNPAFPTHFLFLVRCLHMQHRYTNNVEHDSDNAFSESIGSR
jgi:hypothetical protein